MVDRNLLHSVDLSEEEWQSELEAAFEGMNVEDLDDILASHGDDADVLPNKIVDGKVIRVADDYVVIDVGYKCEGRIPHHEWSEKEDPPAVGQTVKVLIEDIEDAQFGVSDTEEMLLLSKHKAEKILDWERLMESTKEGDVVTGMVMRKIKGGLLVNIGVPVFLPASQVDIRRPSDIGDYIDRTIQCVVLKIDETRRNIVVSRRALIEEEREQKKKQLLRTLQIGQVRKGVVKNIADFGAFVDLGGIDGLLHITDMSWDRISHPTDKVSLDQEIEVMILHIDYDKEKIALGLKQRTPNPWEKVADKYSVGVVVAGEVVNVMTYGAFVKLEAGVEGLVHISEMSWVKRIAHPHELVQIGDEIQVMVLGINQEKQEISLGMKQTQENPWDQVADRFPAGTTVNGTVRNLTNYGAFIEIEEGIDGLLHVSDMSWTRKISHPSEMVEKGQQIECKVLSVDQDRHRIALGLKQLHEDPWANEIPNKYKPGQVLTGTVTKLTNFGVFVGLENGLEGLLHISELADHKVENPEEIVSIGEDIEVKILRVDTDERKIGLSRKRVEWNEEDEIRAEEAGSASTGKPGAGVELKGGVGDSSGPLIQTPAKKTEASEESSPVEETPVEETPVEETPVEETETTAKEAESNETAEDQTETAEKNSEPAEETTASASDPEEAVDLPEDESNKAAAEAS